MAYPVVFDTFVSKIKSEAETHYHGLQDVYRKFVFSTLKIQGANPKLDEYLAELTCEMSQAVNLLGSWNKILHSIPVKSKGDEEEQLVKMVSGLVSESIRLRDECESLKQLIEDSSSSIIVSKRMRSGNHKVEERDALLCQDYIKNNYKLSSEILDKYKLGYHGARARLINLNVWKERGSALC